MRNFYLRLHHYLVNVVVRYDIVVIGVKLIQQCNDLKWRAVCREFGEPNDVTKENSNRIKALGFNRFTSFQRLCNRSRKKNPQGSLIFFKNYIL